ncbi:transposase [Paludisphaera sp. Pla2]|uniref:Transposase n=1 Tax=Paludisphaera mucosa TaxID=3030827 RepID=A0ABT6FE38_9BACT|nr:transposase [Paludisphaera mucosa]MDG3005842.1 transposase [Paludisphaera mucosa]
MAKARRTLTREFKVEAVRRIDERGESPAEVARELDLGESMLRGWRQAPAAEGGRAFPGKGCQPALEEELRRLRAEVERLQAERDILPLNASIARPTFSPESSPEAILVSVRT